MVDSVGLERSVTEFKRVGFNAAFRKYHINMPSCSDFYRPYYAHPCFFVFDQQGKKVGVHLGSSHPDVALVYGMPRPPKSEFPV